VFINVGYVIGLLPVTGIQLPLISAGGTSTATTLFMIGLMTNAARHEPDAVAALRAGQKDRMNRLLRLPLPEPYLPSRVDVLRDRLRSRPEAPKPAAKPAKPVGKPGAKPGKRPRNADQPAPVRRTVKAGTAHGAPRDTGHHGGASRRTVRDAPAPRRGSHDPGAAPQRRSAAAQGRVRQGNGQRRRPRALEGQRFG
jgi:cell division protein FtsW